MNSNPKPPPEPNRWKPGQSGNPKGRPKDKPITAALRELMDRNDGEAIKALAAVALKNALKGDFRFAKEILERVDGKVAEQLDLNADVNNTFDGLSAAELAVISKMRGGPGEE